MSNIGQRLLKTGGALNFAVALLHLVIIFIGAPAYRYFGAGEQMATWAEMGSPLPAAITFCLAILFAVFGLYAFSAADAFRRLPLLVPALLFIGGIYTLRGVLIIPVAIILLSKPSAVLSVEEVVFSLAALGIGLLYLSGTIIIWKRLRKATN
jgi:hypothetical protein